MCAECLFTIPIKLFREIIELAPIQRDIKMKQTKRENTVMPSCRIHVSNLNKHRIMEHCIVWKGWCELILSYAETETLLGNGYIIIYIAIAIWMWHVAQRWSSKTVSNVPISVAYIRTSSRRIFIPVAGTLDCSGWISQPLRSNVILGNEYISMSNAMKIQ